MVLGISRKKAISLACLVIVPAAVAVGAQLGTQIAAYGLIAFTIAILILVATGKIEASEFPFYIFTITLGMMWQTTMCGAHVVGSDMHGEFFVSNTAITEGWDYAKHYTTQSSTSVVVGWLAPLLGKVLPMLFSFVPVILYFAFKKQFGAQIAFYAAIFFMIVPISSLEMAQIGKSMVAELFLALMILVMVVGMKNLYKIPLILVSIAGMILCHYTIALAGIAYLLGILVFRLLALPIKWKLLAVKRVGIITLVVALLFSCTVFYTYYSKADQGVIMEVLTGVGNHYSHVEINAPNTTALLKSETSGEDYSYADTFGDQEVLVRTAIGMDFLNSSLQGKLFRIVQYLTQIAIVIGGLILLWRHKHYKMSAEFVAAIGASYILLALCIFMPHFSLIINMTRFYQLSLFFLAPVFVIGIRELCRNHKINWQYSVVGLLVIYYIFTSGLVFEITKSNSIAKFDTPYSVGLSAERTGVYSIYTKDDVKAAEWLVTNSDNGTMIVGDYNGWHLVASYLGIGTRMREEGERYNRTFDELPPEAYIFVTSWNTEHAQYIDGIKIIWGGAGMRQSFPMPEMNYPIVYRSGDAIIYKK